VAVSGCFLWEFIAPAQAKSAAFLPFISAYRGDVKKTLATPAARSPSLTPTQQPDERPDQMSKLFNSSQNIQPPKGKE
jgi:hypothetical protein